MDPVYLLAILLNAQTGEVISSTVEGQYTTIESCTAEQRSNGNFERPRDYNGTPVVIVHECSLANKVS